MTLRKRGNIYYLYRRVPRQFAAVERRSVIWCNLHTDSESEASKRADAAWTDMCKQWQARVDGETENPEQRYSTARSIVSMHGLPYIRSSEMTETRMSAEAFLQRVQLVPEQADGELNKAEMDALFGVVPEPPVTITRALDLYFDLARAETLGKSEQQIRKWKSPIIQANRDFVALIGNKALKDVTRDDIRSYRSWWLDRIEEQGLSARTANKNIDHLGKVFKLVNEEKRLNINLPIGGLRIKEGIKTTRPPFSDAWIREKILDSQLLDDLNAEARAILFIMVNTGARPSEIVALTKNTIHIDATIPYISIEPEGRAVKTQYAVRRIPLVGVSLTAAREFPDGFPTYRGTDNLTKDINIYLSKHGLRESESHSLYSLRHSFEDRLLRAGVDERIRRDLMGHRLTRERYGKGADLQMLHDLLTPIAI